MDYRLSPSDLTYLYEGCKHCFVLKVKHGITQPSIRLPAVFTVIADLQKEYYSGKRTEDFCPSLPPGIVKFGEKRVRSSVVRFPDIPGTCSINGRFDIVAELDNGSFAVLDFKTASPTDEKVEMYGRQLQAYAYALENPDAGALHLSPVSNLGLLFFSPDGCEYLIPQRQILKGEMQWLPVEVNRSGFVTFLHSVVSLLDGPLPEANPESCDWCKYRVLTQGLGGGESELFKDVSQTTVASCPVCSGPMRLRTGKYGQFWSCMNYPNCKGTRNI